MRLSTVLLALLPACGFSSGSGSGGGDGGGSGNHDGPPDATQCVGSYVRVCFDPAAAVPSAPLTLTSNIDTGSSPVCDTHNDKKDVACVVAAAGLTIPLGTTIRGIGPKPLILLSTTTVDISGTVDVSSSRAGAPGAGGAAAADCPGTTAASNNSGGFGGSFGGQGGNGEPVDVPGANPKGGQAAPALTTFPPTLRGGCPGGAGATDTGVVVAGVGGAGGGAVLIIGQSIQVNGQINASGAGGSGGPAAKAGGGGGGSGGMIVLEAASLTGAGLLFANGGGGGQGGAGVGVGSGAGDPGQESPGPASPAQGGQNGNRSGGQGGAGSSGIVNNNGKPAIGQASNMGGGGAGGGGAGLIHAPGLATAMIAPASKDL